MRRASFVAAALTVAALSPGIASAATTPHQATSLPCGWTIIGPKLDSGWIQTSAIYHNCNGESYGVHARLEHQRWYGNETLAEGDGGPDGDNVSRVNLSWNCHNRGSGDNYYRVEYNTADGKEHHSPYLNVACGP